MARLWRNRYNTKGNEPNVIHGTFHYPGRSEEMQMEIKLLLQMLQLNVYKTIWSPIQIFVDDKLIHLANDNTNI
jgi:hypothetical protein